MLTTKRRLLRLIIPSLFIQVLATFFSVYIILYIHIYNISILIYTNTGNYLSKIAIPRILYTESYLDSLQYQGDISLTFAFKNYLEKVLQNKLLLNKKFNPDFYNDYFICESPNFIFNKIYNFSSWIYLNDSYTEYNKLPKNVIDAYRKIGALSNAFESFIYAFYDDIVNFYIAQENNAFFIEYPTRKDTTCRRIDNSSSKP